MRVLVTGGAGYVGTWVCQLFIKQGYNVTCVDNLRWGANALMHLVECPLFKFVHGDIRDRKLMESLISERNVIVNLAGVVGHPECDKAPIEAQQSNVDAVKAMCQLMQPGQQFIQASTGSVYGRLSEICTEESPTNPLSLYGKTKLEAEKYVLDVGGVCLRFATGFGVSPCMRFDVVPSFFMWKSLMDRCMVVYEGHARRTLISAFDMAQAYLHVSKNYDKVRGLVYNVGTESLNVTKLEIAKVVQKVVKNQEGWEVPIFDESTMKDKDARDYEVSYKRIQATGYRTVVGLEEGLIQTYKAAKIVIAGNANPWRIN